MHAILSNHTKEYLPLHTALQWDSTGCKAAEPSNEHRITFICKLSSVDPLSVSHWEGLEKVQQSMWLLSTEGLWILTLPTPNVFLGQNVWVSAAAPELTPLPLGPGGREGKTWTHTSKSAQVSRGKKQKRMIFAHSFPPLSIKCGERACCGGGGRQNCHYTASSISVRYDSSCL